MKSVLLVLALLIGGCKTPELPTNVFVTDSGTEYKVRIEFSLPYQYKTQYPIVSKAFEDAVYRWAEVVPIDPVFLDQWAYGRRGINLFIIPADPHKVPLGYYMPGVRRIVLNPTALTTYSDAYDVSLHEIGHVFGLQHVGNPDDVGGAIITGMIVVIDEDAEKQLMYPFLSENNKQAGISELDIELVRVYLRRELSW